MRELLFDHLDLHDVTLVARLGRTHWLASGRGHPNVSLVWWRPTHSCRPATRHGEAFFQLAALLARVEVFRLDSSSTPILTDLSPEVQAAYDARSLRRTSRPDRAFPMLVPSRPDDPPTMPTWRPGGTRRLRSTIPDGVCRSDRYGRF